MEEEWRNCQPEGLSFLGMSRFSSSRLHCSLTPPPQVFTRPNPAHTARSGSNVTFLVPLLLVPPLGRINFSHPLVAPWLFVYISIIVACFTFSLGPLLIWSLVGPLKLVSSWCYFQAWAALKRAIDTDFTPEGAEPGQNCSSGDNCFPCLLPLSLKFPVGLTSLVPWPSKMSITLVN